MARRAERHPFRHMPVLSVAGLIALLLSVVLLSLGYFVNQRRTHDIEQLQQQQVEFSKARAPVTLQAACNIDLLALQFKGLQPETRRILQQNVKALGCPPKPTDLPTVPTRVPGS